MMFDMTQTGSATTRDWHAVVQFKHLTISAYLPGETIRTSGDDARVQTQDEIDAFVKEHMRRNPKTMETLRRL